VSCKDDREEQDVSYTLNNKKGNLKLNVRTLDFLVFPIGSELTWNVTELTVESTLSRHGLRPFPLRRKDVGPELET
jgi:hypothetical protein